jgi:hypothetical protein
MNGEFQIIIASAPVPNRDLANERRLLLSFSVANTCSLSLPSLTGFDMGLCMRAYELVGDKIEEILQVYEMLKSSQS